MTDLRDDLPRRHEWAIRACKIAEERNNWPMRMAQEMPAGGNKWDGGETCLMRALEWQLYLTTLVMDIEQDLGALLNESICGAPFPEPFVIEQLIDTCNLTARAARRVRKLAANASNRWHLGDERNGLPKKQNGRSASAPVQSETGRLEEPTGDIPF